MHITDEVLRKKGLVDKFW